LAKFWVDLVETKISDQFLLANRHVFKALNPQQNGNNQPFPLIFTISRQNDDEDTLHSQQHQISELGTV
jgi:hypothetical protein